MLVLSELNANIDGGCDLIELRVVEGGSMDSFVLKERDATVLTFTGLSVATGDFVLVHFNGGSATCNPDGISGGEVDSKDGGGATTVAGAWDWFSTDKGLTSTDNVFSLYDATGAIMDAVFVTEDVAKDQAASGTETQAAEVAAAGEWTKADGSLPDGGFIDLAFCEAAVGGLKATGKSAAAGPTIGRTSATDTNTKSDWGSIDTPTWGAANP